MKLISLDELKEKLDRGDNFKLINTLGEWAFRAKRIPGSIHYLTPEEALNALKKDEEIVVYCAGPTCPASIAAYYALVNLGFTNVRRFAGGLEEWEGAGYPVTGEWISQNAEKT